MIGSTNQLNVTRQTKQRKRLLALKADEQTIPASTLRSDSSSLKRAVELIAAAGEQRHSSNPVLCEWRTEFALLECSPRG